ncbi:MAG: oligopeptide transporter, OPT family [Acidobacteriia bacterium]|nr:oligopeptide transporter, OPT family [Terriglobia bacterium]
MAEKEFKPYVPAQTDLKEFTLRAVLIGVVMCVILGAANAYLGLKAGMTIAATYPAAVIGMALLKLMKGSILEENIARTIGSIGESVAAGAIFTIPAFLIAGVWTRFDTTQRYLESTAIMIVGGIIGIMFVTMLRRVMVEDTELPFPESVAASEIHKAGRRGGTGAAYLFGAMGLGAVIQALGNLKAFADSWVHFVGFAKTSIGLKIKDTAAAVSGSGGAVLSAPAVSPAYMGVGYIIGPKLAGWNFAGGLLAWGLFVPLLLYFLGPQFEAAIPKSGLSPTDYWIALSTAVWQNIVRPIAIGGMLVSAGYTLYRMRKSLLAGLSRSVADAKRAATAQASENRLEKDIKLKIVGFIILLAGIFTFFIYRHFSQSTSAALVATFVMIIAGFFFAAVSGYLVGMIGSSNNPISGLTLCTLLVAAILMVALGMKGDLGVAAVLGVAGVVCVSAAVAGEMLQDLKVGHILGGTPWKMQSGDLIGVVLAGAVMYFPLLVLHVGDIRTGGIGFGGTALPAPQASLMALLSKGIVGGQMAWPLIIVGMLMAVCFILVQVRSPMLVCVGMYLPLGTTFAIFVGGVFRGIVESISSRKKFNEAQNARTTNNGVLIASGLIAGEALVGLVFATLKFFDYKPAFHQINSWQMFKHPSFITSLVMFAIVAFMLIFFPVKNAGSPDEPAPPSAMM